MHSLNKHQWSTSCLPGTVLGLGVLEQWRLGPSQELLAVWVQKRSLGKMPAEPGINTLPFIPHWVSAPSHNLYVRAFCVER